MQAGEPTGNMNHRLNSTRLAAIGWGLLSTLTCLTVWSSETLADTRPNIVFILSDDHRHDCLSSAGNSLAKTPNLDRIASRGTRFSNAFVTLAICSPSRAACLTGQYGGANGVTAIGNVQLSNPTNSFAVALRNSGYATGVTGKWHLKTKPNEAGFQFASVCWANGRWYDRQFNIEGQEKKVMPGFVDDVTADESIRFINQAVAKDVPFMLWMNTQVPHMDHRHSWPATEQFLTRYQASKMPLPESWNDDLAGKPGYLKTARNRTRALEYGYDAPDRIQEHARDYYASVEQMDSAVGRVLDELDRLGIRENTWILFMGDNGWFLGEHGLTSKVLPYEESMRVPMMLCGPSTKAQVLDQLVLNIDLTATIYELAGLDASPALHGRSLLPLATGQANDDWRTSFLYEAPTPQLGSQPLWAVRDDKWKYIRTEMPDSQSAEAFEELYDLQSDSIEIRNLAGDPPHADRVQRMRNALAEHLANISIAASSQEDEPPAIPENPPKPPRTDLFISGIYPHLTTYGVYSQNGAHFKKGHNECGIGAIVPWAGRLWMVNYAPHMPRGSEHKLYSVDSDLTKPITVHPESVGGTPAGRMIHAESKQLLIGHHLVDAEGKVRTIQPADMPMRVTAITRHLKDPANMVYYVGMEGAIWEANVHTLDVKQLFKKPVPGWHGKGGYVSQGRLVVSNNGEHKVGNYDDLQVGGPPAGPEERGVLAEWNGEQWKIVERKQFTEVTGPEGIAGGSDGDAPIWSMGWDRRTVRLKVLDNGQWHTYLLPKAAYCNDAKHGWYTEWPRIREITDGRWLMDMHGMFYDFPKTFSASSSGGIKPVGSHLRYVPDFCGWNGKLVLATDETSIQGNNLAGQPQSNLWFGKYDDLKNWGPASAYGGPWIDDEVKANTPSDPFLVAGFDRRVIHFATGLTKLEPSDALRSTDEQPITEMPDRLSSLPRVTVERGDWREPASGFSFTVNTPVTVYLAVDRRGNTKLDAKWTLTDMTLTWGKGIQDHVYSQEFDAGKVVIPGNTTEHRKGSFGLPHAAFVQSNSDKQVAISNTGKARVNMPLLAEPKKSDGPVTFTLEVDESGTGQWTELEKVTVGKSGYVSHYLPDDFEATWIRFSTDRDTVATAMLHQSSSRFIDGNKPENATLFNGLADVEEVDTMRGLVYAAKRNRNLRVISGDRIFEFTKTGFEFKPDASDEKLKDLLHVKQEFSVDAASVVLNSQGKVYRLPKGHSAFDKPFASGWPRASREVESERHLANIHGTFYEVPLITNGNPPAWNLMRPVSSHRKQITDFCTWNGLLVLAGVNPNAPDDEHLFRNPRMGVGLWFGGIDDLWKLGKPVGDGGPWFETKVRANVASDPYLMKGYDKKELSLSHNSDADVTFTIEVDIDGDGHWATYKEVSVPAGKTVDHSFPSGFSAAWVRLRTDATTTTWAQFKYR